MTPDVTGTYEDAGIWHNKPSYQLVGNGWFIWWDGDNNWLLTFERGNYGPNWWSRTDPDIEGLYTHGGEAIGDATVTKI